jgi:hypothetical protein
MEYRRNEEEVRRDHSCNYIEERKNDTEALAEDRQEKRRDPVVWTPELDAIVREGYARGWSGAREAINKVQRLHPKWRSHVVWERAELLGLGGDYVKERPPWSAADDALLMDFAQEHSVATLARWLHRSETAVRWRFAVLGESARVVDNYTQIDLARDLRVSPKTLRRWEAAGLLERRDGRITHESLEKLCKVCGSEINCDALDKEMQGWLKDYAGLVPTDKQPETRAGVRKHLQRVGVCPLCGRKTRGNAHGRHVKSCTRKARAGEGLGVNSDHGPSVGARSPLNSTT